MKLKNLMAANKFTLVVSPSENKIELIKAILDGGAHAIKLHCNVTHLASGTVFGSFNEEREFIQEVIDMAGDVLIGIVPGADQAFITESECVELEKMGIDFFSVYDKHAPPFLLDSKVLTKMVAIPSDYDVPLVDAINSNTNIDIVEASIVHPDDYGIKLTLRDTLRYSYITERLHQPVLIPTQKNVQPAEVRYLHEAGCKAIMIGKVVIDDSTPEAWLRATSAFREKIEKL